MSLAGMLLVGCAFDPTGSGGPPSDLGGNTDATPVTDARSGLGGGGPDGADAEVDDAPSPPPQLCADDAALVACFEFDGDLLDGTPNDNDLQGTGIAFAPAIRGDGLQLSDGSIVTGPTDTSTLDFTDGMTLEAWIRLDRVQERWFIDHDGQWGLEVQSDGQAFCAIRTVVDKEEVGTDIEGGTVVADVFTHIACTYDGISLTLYQDGNFVTSTLASGPIVTAPTAGFAAGQDAPDGLPFVGLLDRVRIWSRARSVLEIACSFQGSC